MSKYLKLEVTPNGDIYQSSLRVPASGVLPRSANLTPSPRSARAYSQVLFSPYVTVFIPDPVSRQIQAIYIPKLRRDIILAPLIGALFALLGLLVYLADSIFTSHPPNPDEHFFLVAILFYLLVLVLTIPALIWIVVHLTRGAPWPHIRKRLERKYHRIPIYRDYDKFMEETDDK